MSNGCGCETGLLKYIKPPYAKLFYAACCIHDNDYDIGGNKTDRHNADIRLFHNMTQTISKGNYGVLKTLLLTNMAVIYYTSVRIFGHQYFNYK